MSTTRIPAGVDYCTTHHGIRNEDEAACDMAHDMPGACVLHECFCEVTVTIDGDRVRAEDIMSDTPVTPISERIRQALEGTTPGPWSSTRDTDDHFVYQPDGRGPGRSRAVGTAGTTANARLIAAAPTLLADALAEIDRLTAALAERDTTIAERDTTIAEHDSKIGELNEVIDGLVADLDFYREIATGPGPRIGTKAPRQ